ncbi:MAG: hypothetical protein ACK4IY_07185, partial [Chitinophagales bacterium]
WAREYILENKLYIKTPQYRQYNNNDIFTIAGKEFIIKISYQDQPKSTATLKKKCNPFTNIQRYAAIRRDAT